MEPIKIVAGTAVAKIGITNSITSFGPLYNMKDKGGIGNTVYLMSPYAKKFTSPQLPVIQIAKCGDRVTDDIVVVLVGKDVDSFGLFSHT